MEGERKFPFPMSLANVSSTEEVIVAERMFYANCRGIGMSTHVELGVCVCGGGAAGLVRQLWTEWVGSLEENWGAVTKAGEMDAGRQKQTDQ